MDYQFAYDFLKPKVTGNFILDLNPFTKGAILFALSLSGFIVYDYRYAFALALVYPLLAILAGKGRSFLAIYWKIAIGFAFLLFCVRAAFTADTVILFQFAGIHITPRGIDLGLISAALVLEFSGAFILFIKITDMSDLTYMLEKNGASHVFSYILLSSFQTIADLGKSAEVIMDSQKCRGIETEGAILTRLKAFIPVLGPLVLSAIASAEEKTIAMDARAFSSNAQHTSLRVLRPVPFYEKLLVIVTYLLLVGIIFWRISGWIR